MLEIKNLEKTGLYEISPKDQEEIIQWLYFNMDAMKEWTVDTLDEDLNKLLEQGDTQKLLKTNYYDKVLWFNHEAAEMLTDLIRISGHYLKAFDPAGSASEQIEDTILFDKAADMLAERIEEAEYHFVRLIVREETEAEAEEAPASDQDL